MGEATTWARLGAAVAAAAGDDDKTPDTDALIEVVVLPVDAGWWTATDEDAPTTPTPPALNNELPPKAAMKASKLNRGRSFVCDRNGIDDAASQGLQGQQHSTPNY
jgi:hypothetical protein